jgi:hypothetical protein
LFLLFLPHFPGAPRSEGFCFQSERLHSGRDPNLREEPGKQKTRSCRTQELARSSAQENERQKKIGNPTHPESSEDRTLYMKLQLFQQMVDLNHS